MTSAGASIFLTSRINGITTHIYRFNRVTFIKFRPYLITCSVFILTIFNAPLVDTCCVYELAQGIVKKRPKMFLKYVHGSFKSTAVVNDVREVCDRLDNSVRKVLTTDSPRKRLLATQSRNVRNISGTYLSSLFEAY